MDDVTKETLVSILQYSILNIRAASGNKDNKWIFYELEHLIKLLDLFMDISLLKDYMYNARKKYLEQIGECYENQYEDLWNELQNDFENLVLDTLILDETDVVLINIIKIGVNNMLIFANIKDYKNIFIEAYHIHNLPSIIIAKKKEELIKYYLKVECKQYSRDANKVAKQKFENTWKKLRNLIKPEKKFLFFK